MIKLAIFDLDGTLLNTLKDLHNSCNYALGKCGFPTHELNEYKYFVGRGIRNLILSSLPVESRNVANAELVESEFYPYYNTHKCDFTAPYEGIIEVLKTLKEKGVKLAIATNKYQLGAEGVMAEYFSEIDFDLILGQIDTRPVKPAPDIIFDAVKHLGMSLDDVVYLGDSNVDMETGLNAGVKTIGVTWGFREEEELAAYKPWKIIHSPAEILSVVE
jgi:phosphoglycolate phosphatase